MCAGDSMSDLLASCKSDISFIMHRDKSKQFHRVTTNKFGMQSHSLSKNNNNDDVISSSFDGDGSGSNSDDATMVCSSLDLVDTSTFCKKQNKRTLHEIDSWEI